MRQDDKGIILVYTATLRQFGLSSDTSLSPCCWFRSFRELGMTGSKTTSYGQTLSSTCTCLMCTNHAPWEGDNLSNPCPCVSSLKSCHLNYFTWMMRRRLGTSRMHTNSSQPLPTSAGGSAPSPNAASTASTVGFEPYARDAMKRLFSLFPFMCPEVSYHIIAGHFIKPVRYLQ